MVMLLPGIPRACQRAREAVSLQADGELSELGSARLAAHLHSCDACAAYAAEVTAITARLRAAPMEIPASSAMPRSARPARAAARAAAMVAVVSGLAITAGSLRGGQANVPQSATVSIPSVQTNALIFRELDPLERSASTDRSGPTPI